MPKKELSNSEKRRVQLQSEDKMVKKNSYCFPEQGVSVKASSLEEAHLKLEKTLKPKEKNNA